MIQPELCRLLSVAFFLLIYLLAPAFKTLCLAASELKNESASENTLASLQLFDEEDNAEYCSAVLINSRQAISAAHCFQDFHVRASLEFQGQNYNVKEIFRHPKAVYGEKIPLDVAVVELKDQVPLASIHAPNPSALSTLLDKAKNPQLFLSIATKTGKFKLIPATLIRRETGFLVVQGHEPVCKGASGGALFAREAQSLRYIGVISAGTEKNCGGKDLTRIILFSEPEVKLFLASHTITIAQNE